MSCDVLFPLENEYRAVQRGEVAAQASSGAQTFPAALASPSPTASVTSPPHGLTLVKQNGQSLDVESCFITRHS